MRSTTKPRNHEFHSLPVRPRTDDGSAYIVTVLVLLILSVLGLSLVFVTQTEMLIGSQERTIQRTFYAADAGIHVSIIKNVKGNDRNCQEVYFEDPNGGPLVDYVRTSFFFPLQVTACNLCSINSEDDLRRVSYVIQAKAERLADTTALAAKVVELMTDIEPLKLDRVARLDDTMQVHRLECRNGSSSSFG